MKKIIKYAMLFVFFAAPSYVFAQSKQEKEVIEKVEQLKKAMIDGDSLMLDKLTSKNLVYRHSGGHIDDKKEFIQNLASGQSDFVTIELLEQKILEVNKKVVIVYHTLQGKTYDNGKANEVHLYVMLVWEKQRGNWKLVARQAAKKV